MNVPPLRRWARRARVAASEAGDPATYSWVLAQEAYGHYYADDFAEAVNVARHAQDLARSRPCAGAALAAALQARAHAALADHRETRDALAHAETILPGLDAGSVSASAFGYTGPPLRFDDGSGYPRRRDSRDACRGGDRGAAGGEGPVLRRRCGGIARGAGAPRSPRHCSPAPLPATRCWPGTARSSPVWPRTRSCGRRWA